jgi:hypothetical protein
MRKFGTVPTECCQTAATKPVESYPLEERSLIIHQLRGPADFAAAPTAWEGLRSICRPPPEFQDLVIRSFRLFYGLQHVVFIRFFACRTRRLGSASKTADG